MNGIYIFCVIKKETGWKSSLAKFVKAISENELYQKAKRIYIFLDGHREETDANLVEIVCSGLNKVKILLVQDKIVVDATIRSLAKVQDFDGLYIELPADEEVFFYLIDYWKLCAIHLFDHDSVAVRESDLSKWFFSKNRDTKSLYWSKIEASNKYESLKLSFAS